MWWHTKDLVRQWALVAKIWSHEKLKNEVTWTSTESSCGEIRNQILVPYRTVVDVIDTYIIHPIEDSRNHKPRATIGRDRSSSWAHNFLGSTELGITRHHEQNFSRPYPCPTLPGHWDSRYTRFSKLATSPDFQLTLYVETNLGDTTSSPRLRGQDSDGLKSLANTHHEESASKDLTRMDCSVIPYRHAR